MGLMQKRMSTMRGSYTHRPTQGFVEMMGPICLCDDAQVGKICLWYIPGVRVKVKSRTATLGLA